MALSANHREKKRVYSQHATYQAYIPSLFVLDLVVFITKPQKVNKGYTAVSCVLNACTVLWGQRLTCDWLGVARSSLIAKAWVELHLNCSSVPLRVAVRTEQCYSE